MTIIVIIVIALLIVYLGTKNKKSKAKTYHSSEKNNATFTIDIDKHFNKAIQQDYKKSKESFNDIAGFYGTEEFSENKKYCVICNGVNHDEKGEIALISVEGKKLLFKKQIARPNDCHVSNNGVVICCDWTITNLSTGKFLVFDKAGVLLYSQKTIANLGNCGISNDGKIALFETYNSNTKDSDSIFLIDIEAKEQITRFERPFSFIKPLIDTQSQRIKLINNRDFVFEIDFSGKQTNRDDYEKQIIDRGSIYDKLSHYFDKPDEIKLKDSNYLGILKKALIDEDASYSFGRDKLYRMLGEFHEANGDVKQTIENWEKAIEINPKVGIKRKLDLLKNK